MPDFEPFNGENAERFEVKNRQYLIINLHENPDQTATLSPIGDSNDLSGVLAKKLLNGYSAAEVTSAGLQKYTNNSKGRQRTDIYVRTKNGTPILIVECSRDGDWPNPQCESTKPILNKLTLYYRFPTSFLESALLIDEKTETLIKSFLQERRK
ncbi:hypothetical protein SQ11_12520 [Nitrosospira sp. NpAV]|nr:hypothetical protein SQ11_12520 [Nitrosospira sp. NpAV]